HGDVQRNSPQGHSWKSLPTTGSSPSRLLSSSLPGGGRHRRHGLSAITSRRRWRRRIGKLSSRCLSEGERTIYAVALSRCLLLCLASLWTAGTRLTARKSTNALSLGERC